jgi:cell division protein FtsI/penicillin-binding protein 2
MHEVVASGTLAGVLTQPGAYGKTGTAEVGTGKTPNSWTIAVHGDFAVAALAIGGNFGAQTAGPECNTLLKAVS